MANKDVDAFIRAAELDPSLADALLNASGPDELVKMGAARGFDFTRDELRGCLASASNELRDGQLDGVSGGASQSIDGQPGAVAGSAGQPVSYLKYKLDRCFVKSWSTGGAVD